MVNLIPDGATTDACDKVSGVRLAVLSRVVAVALLTPLVGYLLEENNDRVWEVLQDYSRSELFVFAAGCAFIACVEALAWLMRMPFTRGRWLLLKGREGLCASSFGKRGTRA
jgi:hypothetical protein